MKTIAGASVALWLILAASITIVMRTTAAPLPENELTKTIVAVGEVRKSYRGPVMGVPHETLQNLTTRVRTQ
jgi:hypothetical protein